MKSVKSKSLKTTKHIADKILADGWMRPPCKVGDTVWYLNKHPHITLLQNSIANLKSKQHSTLSAYYLPDTKYFFSVKEWITKSLGVENNYNIEESLRPVCTESNKEKFSHYWE